MGLKKKMETNPSKIDMETADLSPTEWLEKFIIISKEELELSKKSSNDNVIVSMVNEYYEEQDDGYNTVDDDDNCNNDNNYYNDDDDDNDDDDNDDNDDNDDDDDDDDDDEKYSKELTAQYGLRMIRIGPLFASQPRLEKICKDWKNRFLPTCFTTYTFRSNKNDSVKELHEKANDLECLINLCGTNLTCLNLTQYPISQIMPIINANCPSLEELYLGFKEIMSQDFENVFSNMSRLRSLSILWQCGDSTLPMTLAKSLEQISGTLKRLNLSCNLKRHAIFSPDSLASVFPRLIALNTLNISNFGLSQLLLQSIGEIKNLAHLSLTSLWLKNHPMFDARINMYPIGNLKNLKSLDIWCEYGVKDEFLINLCNNAKKLAFLSITGTNITDIGMSAIDNLEQLKDFDLGLTHSLVGSRSQRNEFITDESIQCLFNQKLQTLDVSNCIKITDKALFKLVENLPNLTTLYIRKTKVTREAVKKIYKLTKYRQKPIDIYYTVKNGN